MLSLSMIFLLDFGTFLIGLGIRGLEQILQSCKLSSSVQSTRQSPYKNIHTCKLTKDWTRHMRASTGSPKLSSSVEGTRQSPFKQIHTYAQTKYWTRHTRARTGYPRLSSSVQGTHQSPYINMHTYQLTKY